MSCRRPGIPTTGERPRPGSPSNPVRERHDRYAPWWAAGLALLVTTGLAATWFDGGTFWKGYLLDMAGPAWAYILIRGRFTAWADNRWTRFFTPTRTVTILGLVAFAIETAQYFELYAATFDPLDLLAYVSLLVPLYAVDRQTG